VTSFGPVKDSGLEQRRAWLEQAEQRGLRLRAGVFSRRRVVLKKATGWLQALRLQFYPMAWLAYGVGALAAIWPAGTLQPAAFWWGLICLFFIEVAAVLTNECCDLETDRHNRNFGPFTGGSRALVDGKLNAREIRSGIAAVLGLAAVSGAALIAAIGPNLLTLLALIVLAKLALG
jgi:1,4-dihydroxy-2-naphthoate octaprenyltransferase